MVPFSFFFLTSFLTPFLPLKTHTQQTTKNQTSPPPHSLSTTPSRRWSCAQTTSKTEEVATVLSRTRTAREKSAARALGPSPLRGMPRSYEIRKRERWSKRREQRGRWVPSLGARVITEQETHGGVGGSALFNKERKNRPFFFSRPHRSSFSPATCTLLPSSVFKQARASRPRAR